MKVVVTRTYLELTSPGDLRPASVPEGAVRVVRLGFCPAAFYRWLYAEVGRPYTWVDRLGWSDERIREHLASPAVTVSLLSVGGAPAGYYELQGHEGSAVEIAYFGLLVDFHGRGLGKHLLTVAVREAWERGASRVWLHTCSLDGPAALPNYLARGFRVYKTETYEADRPVAS